MADKKILQEEILSDEQLENVVGGSSLQTAQDSEVLYKLGLLDKSYTKSDIVRSVNDEEWEVQNAFFKLGIMMVYYSGYSFNNSSNLYFFGKQELTQDEAWALAESQAKKLKLGIYSE